LAGQSLNKDGESWTSIAGLSSESIRQSCAMRLQRAGAGLQDVGDVPGAEGLKGETVGDGARHGIAGIELGQCQNLADVMAGIEPALFQAVVIGCRIRRQRQEVHHQALFAGAAALGDQRLGVIRVFDVLVAAIRGSGRNNLRQHLHLRRSPQPIASPPRRTHHPQIRCPVCSRCKDEPSRSFCLSKRSDDHADRACDYKFNPLVLAEM
jgi:hypothetical protein